MKKKNIDEQTRGNLIGFSSIHLLVPRFSIGGFPPQESRGGKFAAIPRPHTTPRESRILGTVGHAINWIESSNR